MAEEEDGDLFLLDQTESAAAVSRSRSCPRSSRFSLPSGRRAKTEEEEKKNFAVVRFETDADRYRLLLSLPLLAMTKAAVRRPFAAPPAAAAAAAEEETTTTATTTAATGNNSGGEQRR